METELEVDVQGEAGIPVTDCSSCYFISTTLISEHGNSILFCNACGPEGLLRAVMQCATW